MKPKILISPLNWGLGHASRITPIIHACLNSSYSVILAADGRAFSFLKNEFPDLPLYRLKDINIKYSKNLPFIFKMLVQSPYIFYNRLRENNKLKKLIKKENVDIIISDNRYGLYNHRAYNIIVTHQVYLQLPNRLKSFQGVVNGFMAYQLNKFEEIWIPDTKNNNLSGDLSHPKLNEEVRYIGFLSRLKKLNSQHEYDCLIILSGPEPQRTILEEIIVEELKLRNEKIVLIRGLPQSKKQLSPINNVIIYNHLSASELSNYMSASKFVISRSGYSTLMDLMELNKPAILIPTPGQTEQEYLVKHLEGESFKSISQKEFSISKAFTLSYDLKKPNPHRNDTNLMNLIQGMIQRSEVRKKKNRPNN